MIRFFPGHDRPRGTGDLDRMMIAAHNVTHFEPPADGWMLDSGGFTQLTTRGAYTDTPKDYVRFVEECQEQIGGLVAAFQQDYPANGDVLDATRTWPHEEGRGTDALVTRSWDRWLHTYHAAREEGCDLMAPVLQGQAIEDYARNLRLIEHTLTSGDLVGIGNLKADGHGPAFLRELMLRLDEKARQDYRFHALGIGKRYIFDQAAGPTLRRQLWSFDSAAWKVRARYADRDQNTTAFANEYASAFTASTPLFH